MICNNCGTNNMDGAYVCSTCGTPLNNAAPATDPGKGMAIASLVCGLVSLLCCGGIVAILAVVFGIIAKKKGSTSGMATAGLILGIVTFVIGILLSVLGVTANLMNYAQF